MCGVVSSERKGYYEQRRLTSLGAEGFEVVVVVVVVHWALSGKAGGKVPLTGKDDKDSEGNGRRG